MPRPDYITEKALRPYRVGAVPIVFEARAARAASGAGSARDGSPVPNYAQYFPEGSYINAAAFDSFAALGAHLRAVGSSRELWMKYHAHRDAATAPRHLAAWRRQHRRAIGDPACRLAHRTLAFLPPATAVADWIGASPRTRPDQRLLWPEPTPTPGRGKEAGGTLQPRASGSGAARQNSGPLGVALYGPISGGIFIRTLLKTPK